MWPVARPADAANPETRIFGSPSDSADAESCDGDSMSFAEEPASVVMGLDWTRYVCPSAIAHSTSWGDP